MARGLGLTGFKDWHEYSKSGKRPLDIPSNPNKIYSRTGEWTGWPDFLGTGNIRPQDVSFAPWPKARAFARGLGLKSIKHWSRHWESNERPLNIPADPEHFYKKTGEWTNWGDFLGTGNKRPKDMEFGPWPEVREFARGLGLANKGAWSRRWESNDIPSNIPKTPASYYKKTGEWTNWGDFLGTGNIRPQDMEFDPWPEVREFMRGRGLKSLADWQRYLESGKKPRNIPANPAGVYGKTGEWTNWPDFLGYTPSKWTRFDLLTFIKSLRGPTLETLTETELLVFITTHRGALPAFMKAFGKRSPLEVIKDLKENEGRKIEAVILAADEAGEEEEDLDDEAGGMEITEDVQDVLEEDSPEQSLPAIFWPGVLHTVDVLDQKTSGGLDEEFAEFLVSNRLASLWNAYAKGDPVDGLLGDDGEHYYDTIRNRFEYQRTEVENLAVPAEWSFKEHGTNEITPPNAMQKRTAWELLTKKRVGNFSGAGAGKTNSALLATRITESRNVLVVAANNTIDGWIRAIENTFPDTVIHTRVTPPVPGEWNITILNYERFQQPNWAYLVHQVVKIAPDFVVLDELQFAKRRYQGRDKNGREKQSTRREALEALLCALGDNNPDLRVLGMSATPVTNNLYEGIKLLELITGVSFADLRTGPTIMNALAVHRSFMVYGFRYKPDNKIKINPVPVEIVNNDLLEQLRGIRTPLQVEQILLDDKLERLYADGHFRKGTLVYTEFVNGMVGPTQTFLEDRGFSVGRCTGDDKSGLQPFRKKKLDILIGSKTVATGVDGLQHCCDNVIYLSPPWTGADEYQVEGRLVRQGSVYDSVTKVWPQVFVEIGTGRWSWDEQRREIIQFKRTLSDCAVDGTLPKALSPGRMTLLKRAREDLEELITRLEEDGLSLFERPKLVIPLPPETRKRAQRKHGDFTKINQRWSSSNSTTIHDRLKDEPEEWYLYHSLYRKAREKWDEIPAEHIARQLEGRPDLKVGDFGCGECLLADALPDHEVVGLDHVADVAINDSVIACDMAHTPLEDASLDAAVFSLSLMGRNWPDYLEEARRTLKTYGLLFVAETAKRWEDLGGVVGEHGFDVIRCEQRGEFEYLRAIKAD